MPYKTATGKVYDSGDFTAHMKRAMEVANWKEFSKRAKAAKKLGRKVMKAAEPKLKDAKRMAVEGAEKARKASEEEAGGLRGRVHVDASASVVRFRGCCQRCNERNDRPE